MFRLDDKICVVAGGAGYLGSSICRGMAEQGATVVVSDVDQSGAEMLAEDISSGELHGRCLALPFDLREEGSSIELIQQVRKDLGRLDVLVNTTYAPHGRAGNVITLDEFATSMKVNVAANFQLVREAKKVMMSGGNVILFSSMYGRVAPDPRAYEEPMTPNPIEYGVSKAGIEQMIRYLAVAWAPEGIRVNGVSPGPFPHPQLQKKAPKFVRRLADRVPMGRIGKQHEITGAVVFLASDEASYITGQTLVVDGGWTVW